MFSIALLGIAVAIVAEGALSDPRRRACSADTPTWGNMIAVAAGRPRRARRTSCSSPSLVIFLTVLSLNFLGDVVRARFDVRESAL